MFWMHAPLFAVLAILILTELYLTADIVDLYKDVGGTSAHQRLNYALFCSVWSFLFVIVHWAAPFIVAFGWSVTTCGFWVIAAALLSTLDCAGDGDGRVCLADVGRVRAAAAFAWIIVIVLIFLPITLFWHAKVRADAAWRQGVYGRRLPWRDESSPATGGISIKTFIKGREKA